MPARCPIPSEPKVPISATMPGTVKTLSPIGPPMSISSCSTFRQAALRLSSCTRFSASRVARSGPGLGNADCHFGRWAHCPLMSRSRKSLKVRHGREFEARQPDAAIQRPPVSRIGRPLDPQRQLSKKLNPPKIIVESPNQQTHESGACRTGRTLGARDAYSDGDRLSRSASTTRGRDNHERRSNA
jgi:hypothetical protein